MAVGTSRDANPVPLDQLPQTMVPGDDGLDVLERRLDHGQEPQRVVTPPVTVGRGLEGETDGEVAGTAA